MNLFEHDNLMTPVLTEQFGEIYAEIIDSSETEDTYDRTSVLRQRSTGKKLINARLIVHKTEIPSTLIDELKATDTPFGQLLIDYNIDVFIQTRQANAMGRELDIVSSKSGKTICSVKEELI